MMSGRLFIDGYDVYKNFGVYVIDGGWNSLISMPPLKPVEQNDWHEEDGVEVDLSSPVLNSREVLITFAVSGVFNRYAEFINMLSDGSYHEFNCEYIKRKFTLRLLSSRDRQDISFFGRETLKFSDDFPLITQEEISSVIPADEEAYSIDGVSFSTFGMRILDGSFTEIVKSPAVKQNMLRNIKAVGGVIYDGKEVFYNAKEVRLNCLMRAENLESLWAQYEALLALLIQPEERLLWVGKLEQVFPCHYKSCSVAEFSPEDRPWLKFSLNIVFTHDFRINHNDVLLASEDGVLITTENEAYFIDLRLDRYSYPSVRFVNNKQTLRLTNSGDFRFND